MAAAFLAGAGRTAVPGSGLGFRISGFGRCRADPLGGSVAGDALARAGVAFAVFAVVVACHMVVLPRFAPSFG